MLAFFLFSFFYFRGTNSGYQKFFSWLLKQDTNIFKEPWEFKRKPLTTITKRWLRSLGLVKFIILNQSFNSPHKIKMFFLATYFHVFLLFHSGPFQFPLGSKQRMFPEMFDMKYTLSVSSCNKQSCFCSFTFYQTTNK